MQGRLSSTLSTDMMHDQCLQRTLRNCKGWSSSRQGANWRAYPLDHIQGCVARSVVADHEFVDAIGVRHPEGREIVTLQAQADPSVPLILTRSRLPNEVQ